MLTPITAKEWWARRLKGTPGCEAQVERISNDTTLGANDNTVEYLLRDDDAIVLHVSPASFSVTDHRWITYHPNGTNYHTDEVEYEDRR